MSESERQIGELIAGQRHINKALDEMATAISEMATNQAKFLKIQEQHHANERQLAEHKENLKEHDEKLTEHQMAIEKNTSFRLNMNKMMWIVVTPIISVAAIGLTVAAFAGLFE